MIVAQRNWA